MKIVIMTTCYNASQYIERCILTVKHQSFRNYMMVITDDMSTDNSVDVAIKTIDGDPRFLVIRNDTKMYQPGNYWQISHKDFVEPDDILVTLDGDDWFPDENVLSRVFSYYFYSNILMSFGQFGIFTGNDKPLKKGFTRKPIFDNLRNEPWTTSHLRTFKAKVFNSINEDDLKSPNGNYWEVTGDMAIIYPMLEMVGENYVHFTDDLNLIYNCETPFNDFKVNQNRQIAYEQMIRRKPKYNLKDFS